MNKKLYVKHSLRNFNRDSSLMPFSIGQIEEKNLKPAEEWIYGTFNKLGNNTIKTFKNQSAFNGYQKNRIDLYKSIILFIYFLVL